MSNGPISWESKKQGLTVLPGTEAEYVSLDHACKEALFLKGFLYDLYQRPGPILIYNDNLSTLQLSEVEGFHPHTKHNDLRYHFIREIVKLNKVYLCMCQPLI